MKGLASAIEFFDTRVVNRILLNNCGISGDSLALILDGILKLKDFKALVYKMNGINSAALNKINLLFERRLPHHLEELKIIDCKINQTLIQQLLDALLKKSQIKKFALVNAMHSELTFDKLVAYVGQSEYLRELDVSWSTVRP